MPVVRKPKFTKLCATVEQMMNRREPGRNRAPNRAKDNLPKKELEREDIRHDD